MKKSQQLEQGMALLSERQYLRQVVKTKFVSGLESSCVVRGKQCIDYTNNDYLGLRFHPEVAKAIQQSISLYGNGGTSSPMLSGYNPQYSRIEQAFADWLGVEKCVLFTSGYTANIGVISSLCQRKDVVVSDKFCHRSILDGVVLSRAKHYRYQHQDLRHLYSLLNRKPCTIITEGIFSMEGTKSNPLDLTNMAESTNSALIIDDAHGIGTMGSHGLGITEGYLQHPSLLCLVLPLGKAFCSLGAIVAGDKAVIDHIRQHAGPLRYSTALPPSVLSGIEASLQVIQKEPWRREKLHQNIQLFNQLAIEQEIPLKNLENTPIRIMEVNDIDHLLKIKERLWQYGINVAEIRPPTVPTNRARVRITLNATHTKVAIKRLIGCLKELIP